MTHPFVKWAGEEEKRNALSGGVDFKVVNCTTGKGSVSNIKNLGEGAWKSDSVEKKAVVELELPELQKIKSIVIGNYGATFVEIMAGQPGMSPEQFSVLLPITAIMNIQDSKADVNTERIYKFTPENFRKQIGESEWKRLRIACTCPFSPRILGLNFVVINPGQQTSEKPTEGKEPIGNHYNLTRHAEDSSGTDEIPETELKQLHQKTKTTKEEESSGTEEMAASPAPKSTKGDDQSSSGTEDMAEEELQNLKASIYGTVEPQELEDPRDSEASLLGHPYPLMELPSFFSDFCFYFYGNFEKTLEQKLYRVIVAYGGDICDYFYEDKINIVILSPSMKWDKSCSTAIQKNPSLRIIQYQWVFASEKAKAVVPIKPFLVARKQE